MSAPANQAQVKPTPKCDQCEKPFSTKQALTRHVKTIHDGIVSLKNLFSTPKALPNNKRLFTSVPNLSTQGNSAGKVNVQEVVSEGYFMCGVCDETFPNEDELTNHISDAHDEAESVNNSAVSEANNDVEESNVPLVANNDNDESEFMFDPQDDQDLNEAFDEIHKDLARKEDSSDSLLLQQRLERFKVLIKKKTLLKKETISELANYKQIETHKDDVIKKKEKEIVSLKKAAAKEREKYSKDIESLRKSNSSTIKENGDLYAKLKEKESIIKSLEEAPEPDTSDDEEEVVIMNRNTSGHKCTACNKKYSTNDDLESHMDEMHGEVECIFCSKIFENKKKVKAHVNNCTENGTAKVNCNKCSQSFTRFGIEKHRKQCQMSKRNFKCQECGMLGNSEREIKKHMNIDHKYTQEVSQEVCYHYRQGNCFKGDRCRFSHVGYQKSNNSSTWRQSTTRMWTPACTQGDGCSWLARGACRYFHRGVQRPAKQFQKSDERTQQRPNQTGHRGEGGRGPCRYGGNCFRKETCGFSHSPESDQGFPPLTRRNQQIRRNGGRH